MLDLVAHGAEGHRPVHLLLVSADELGFAWDGEEKGWVLAALPPLRMCGNQRCFKVFILVSQHVSFFLLQVGHRVRDCLTSSLRNSLAQGP